MRNRVVLSPEAALGAREVVEEPGVAGLLLEEVLVRLDRFLPVLVREVHETFGVPLPRGRRERLPGLAAGDDDRRPGLNDDRGALRSRVADEDERARGRVDLVPVDRERRAAL